MSELFRRRMRIEVGPPGGEGRSWDSLRLTCAVKKTGRPAPNGASVTITNLNKDSRGWLEKRDLAVLVFAGYEDSPPLLFAGQVDKVTHTYQGTEWVTTIEARDGAVAYRTVSADVSRGPVNSATLLQRVALSLGLKLPSLPPSLPVVDYPRGYPGGRRGRELLNQLAEELGFGWSIQNGSLVIAPAGEPASPRVRLYQAGTGLIGSPEKTKLGVVARVQLDARLVPGDLIQIESKVISGLYLIRTVEHSADSHEGDFVTVVEASRR